MYIPSEFDLQLAYDLSKGEARIYRMRLNGMKSAEIADFNRITVQSVKNTLGGIKHKIELRNHPMKIITVNQKQSGLVRKSIVQMAFKVLAKDQNLSEIHEGKYTITIEGVSPNLGDKDFMVNEVFKEINLLVTNEIEAKKTADKIFEKYLEKGGEKGKMGYGWVLWLFNKFFIMYDMY